MIKKFNSSYLDEIINITKSYWSGEVKLDEELLDYVYSMLVKYNITNEDFSYVSYSDKVDAFIFGAVKNESSSYLESLEPSFNELNERNKEGALEYVRYLDYNYDQVMNLMDDKSIYIGLVASTKHNEGRRLIDKLIEDSKALGYNKVFLWTDETCNYNYYNKLGFTCVSEYTSKLFDLSLKTFVYVKNI